MAQFPCSGSHPLPNFRRLAWLLELRFSRSLRLLDCVWRVHSLWDASQQANPGVGFSRSGRAGELIWRRQRCLDACATGCGQIAQPAGILAAAGWAFFVPAQTYVVILMPTALVIFVFWLVVWWIVREDVAPGKLCALTLGLVTGITATTIATILFLLPLLIGAVLIKPVAGKANDRVRARIVSVILVFAGMFAGTAPCWAQKPPPQIRNALTV